MPPSPPKPARSLVVIAYVNLVFILTVLVWSSIEALLLPTDKPDSVLAVLGSVCLGVFFLPVGIVQYRSVFRSGVISTTIMSVLSFGGAALAFFALVSNIGEELLRGRPFDDVNVVFASVGLAIAAYAILVGLLSVRWKRELDSWHSREPICLNCGYNLTGNVSGICPECGQAIVARPDPSREVDHVQ